MAKGTKFLMQKGRCANCGKRGRNLVSYGGFHYHQKCLDALLTAIAKAPPSNDMFKRLGKAFNAVIRGKEGRDGIH